MISTPHPSKPEELKDAGLKFRSLINDLKSKKQLVCFYPRLGRGSIVIFDVHSNNELHQLMTQWLNLVTINFRIIPLSTPFEAKKLLK